jgi:hypothetical protein
MSYSWSRTGWRRGITSHGNALESQEHHRAAARARAWDSTSDVRMGQYVRRAHGTVRPARLLRNGMKAGFREKPGLHWGPWQA